MKKHEYLAEKSTLAAIVPLILGLYLIPESAPQAIKVFSLIIISLSSLMIMEFVSPFPCIPVMEMPIYGYQSIKDVPLMMRPFYMGPLPNSALKGKAKSLTKLPVDNFAFSFNLPLFLIF